MNDRSMKNSCTTYWLYSHISVLRLGCLQLIQIFLSGIFRPAAEIKKIILLATFIQSILSRARSAIINVFMNSDLSGSHQFIPTFTRKSTIEFLRLLGCIGQWRKTGADPGFANRRGANEYVQSAYIPTTTSAVYYVRVQGPFKGPGSSGF